MNIMQMMKQAENIQRNMKLTQEELANTEVVGEAGSGAVKVTFDGKGQFKSISLSSEVSGMDNEMLEDIITTAMVQATNKASQVMEEKLKAVTGGINIPGLNGLFK
ncbi:YbaB/EbfC family nucleoid-associated protein [bacterium]|nr:YbaB/EbfC family nucleoid-associated protein [bacterium]